MITHIPSTLSQIKYIDYLFMNKIVQPYNHRIIIGKPFGSYAYYIPWFKLGLINSVNQSKCNNILKHDDFQFVDYSDEVVGNSLGIASGMCLVQNKLTWINVSDSIFQCGVFLEAAQFVGEHKQNIKMTIDYNRMQLTSKLKGSLKMYVNILKAYGWKVKIQKNNFDFSDFEEDGPCAYFMLTHKNSKDFNGINDHYKIDNEKINKAYKILKGYLDEKNISSNH